MNTCIQVFLRGRGGGKKMGFGLSVAISGGMAMSPSAFSYSLL
jgi:hypothetical protein